MGIKLGKSITGDSYFYRSTGYLCVMLFGHYIELRTKQSEVEKWVK